MFYLSEMEVLGGALQNFADLSVTSDGGFIYSSLVPSLVTTLVTRHSLSPHALSKLELLAEFVDQRLFKLDNSSLIEQLPKKILQSP